jgi:hypothetical protein
MCIMRYIKAKLVPEKRELYARKTRKYFIIRLLYVAFDATFALTSFTFTY